MGNEYARVDGLQTPQPVAAVPENPMWHTQHKQHDDCTYCGGVSVEHGHLFTIPVSTSITN